MEMATREEHWDMARQRVGNVIIENVALVDGLKHNLLSVSQLTDRGYDVKFTSTHGEVVCKKTGKVALIGPILDNMYVAKLHLNTDDGTIKMSVIKSISR